MPAYLVLRGDEMTINQLLNLDYSEPENREVIQECLKKIKPLSKYEDDVPFEKIEKLIVVLSKKYNFRIREFVPDVWSNDDFPIWRATLIDDRNLNTAGIIYGLSVYEVFAKVAIYMYGIKDKITERKVW